MPLHLVGISSGRVWHTVRRPIGNPGWASWDDLTVRAGALRSAPQRIACALVDGMLHVCVTTADGGLFHTMQLPGGGFQQWGDAGATAFPTILLDGPVDCAARGSQLHVCVSGFTRGDGQTLASVWRSIRVPTRWSPPQRMTDGYPVIDDIACAGVGTSELHVLARCTRRTTGQRLLIHNIRFQSGVFQPAGDQDVLGQFPGAAATLAGLRTVAAAGIGPGLHVVASDGTQLFFTIRIDNTAWLPTFASVRTLVGDGFSGPLSVPACANDGGNLHICVISGGTIFHTIRLTGPGIFRNPEEGTRGFWGNVNAAVQPGPAGAPQASFIDIACAGFSA